MNAVTTVKLGTGSVIQTVSQTFAPYGDSGSDSKNLLPIQIQESFFQSLLL